MDAAANTNTTSMNTAARNNDGEDATRETASRSSNASRSSTLSSDRADRRVCKVPKAVKTVSCGDTVTDDIFVDELEDSGDGQDSDSLDSEFEAYVAAHRARKKKRRKEKVKESVKESLQPSRWSKMFQLVCVGLLVQLVMIICVVVVFTAMEKKNTTPASASTNVDPPKHSVNHSYPLGAPHVEVVVPHVEVAVLQPPPHNIHYLCDPLVQTSGLQNCQNVCNRALCCHISRDQPYSCWNDNLETCQEYLHACSVLGAPDTGGGGGGGDNPRDDEHSSIDTTVFPNAHVLWGQPNLLPPAPPQLAQACQAAFVWEDNILGVEETSGATLTCHEVCHAAQCCWDSSLTEPADRCWTHPNCGAYVESCRFLMKARDEKQTAAVIPQASANIAQYCDPNVMKDGLEDLLTCQAACLPAESCWNEAMLDRSDSEQCNGYNDACSILSVPLPLPDSSTAVWSPLEQQHATVTNVGVTNASALSQPAVSSAAIYPPETIWDACLNHDNTVNIRDGQQTLCQQACQAGKCCFGEDETGSEVSQSCPSYLPTSFCEKYTPCETIFAGGSNGGKEARVREACSNLQDLSDCVALCGEEEATCCFTSDPWKICAVTHPNTVCNDYKACEVLYGGAAESSTGRKNDPLRRRSLLRNERRAS